MGISNANTFVCRMLWMYCVIDKSQSPFLDVFYPQYLEPLNISVASAPSTVISDNEDCLLIYVKYLCCIERTTQILKVALGVSPVFFLYSLYLVWILILIGWFVGAPLPPPVWTTWLITWWTYRPSGAPPSRQWWSATSSGSRPSSSASDANKDRQTDNCVSGQKSKVYNKVLHQRSQSVGSFVKE